MCRNETLQGLPRGTAVTAFALQANGKKSRGVTSRGAGAQWAHHCGVEWMRFLFLMSYGLSLSEEIISTRMNIDNWPLNCHRNIKHLFSFFTLCSDNCYINPKNVPEHSQNVKFQSFSADDNQPYVKIKNRKSERDHFN